MNKPVQQESVQPFYWADAWTKIDMLDLTQIQRKLVLPRPEGSGFSAETVALGILWYRRFLKLCAKYPENRSVPNRLIDEVWHAHILDTRKYAIDCFGIFSRMLHHFPYFGLNDDAHVRNDCFELTDQLYLKEFGESVRTILANVQDLDNADAALLGAVCDATACYSDPPGLDAPQTDRWVLAFVNENRQSGF